MHFSKKQRRKALGAGSQRTAESGLKIIAVSPAEGGLVVHKPDGSQAIVPQSDDRTKNAALLGELVLEILEDDAQPSAQMVDGPARSRSGRPEDEFRPQAGEDPDDYVRRVGIRAAARLWRTLQRVSGTDPD